MLTPGTARDQLARTLRSAYAAGLLSEDTFQARVQELLAATVLEPARLVGDLNLREHRHRPASIARAWRRLSARLAPERQAPRLLALDWGGDPCELLLGREPACQVVLSDPTVSRRHARLRFRDGVWLIEDLRSRNGTIVNGVAVGRCELRPGDELRLGGSLLQVD